MSLTTIPGGSDCLNHLCFFQDLEGYTTAVYLDDRPMSLTTNAGGSDCLNLVAFSLSLTFNVYKYRLHRTLNFTVLSFFFMIFTDFASFLLAVRRKSLISLISRAILCFDCSVAILNISDYMKFDIFYLS